MKTEADLEVTTAIENMPHVEFFNEFSERFVIYTNGILVFMAGDEVNAMVKDKNKIADTYIQLFNPAFSIWSADELVMLGKSLKTLGNKIKHQAAKPASA